MTPNELRNALDLNGYRDAEIRNTVVIVRDRDPALSYADHKRALKAAGIPVLWGGLDIHSNYYWMTVRLEAAE